MSKQYENDMALEIDRATDVHIRAHRCGYSGSNAMPQPDILVRTPEMDHAAELKGPIQSDSLYVDEDDLEQIVACENSYTAVYLVVKFSRREPLVVQYYGDITGNDEWADMSVIERFEALVPEEFNPRITESRKLAIDKPSTEDWPSATAGASDVDALISGFGIPTDDSVVIEL